MPTSAKVDFSARGKDLSDNTLPKPGQNIDPKQLWQSLVDKYPSWEPRIYKPNEFIFSTDCRNAELFYLAYKAINHKPRFRGPKQRDQMAEIARSFLTEVNADQIPEHFLNKMTPDNWLSLVKQGRGLNKDGQPLPFVSKYAEQLFNAARAILSDRKSNENQWHYALDVLELLTKCESSDQNDNGIDHSNIIMYAHFVLALSVLHDKANGFLSSKSATSTSFDYRFNNSRTFNLQAAKGYYHEHINYNDIREKFSSDESDYHIGPDGYNKMMENRLDEMHEYSPPSNELANMLKAYNAILCNPELPSNNEKTKQEVKELPHQVSNNSQVGKKQPHSPRRRSPVEIPDQDNESKLKNLNQQVKGLDQEISTFVEETAKYVNDAKVAKTREEILYGILGKINDFKDDINETLGLRSQIQAQKELLEALSTDNKLSHKSDNDILPQILPHVEKNLNKDQYVIYTQKYIKTLQRKQAELDEELKKLEENGIKESCQAAKNEYQNILLEMYCDNSGFFVGGKRKVTKFEEIPEQEKEPLLLRIWPKWFLSSKRGIVEKKHGLRNFLIDRVIELRKSNANSRIELINSIKSCATENTIASEIADSYEEEHRTNLQNRFCTITNYLNYQNSKYWQRHNKLSRNIKRCKEEISELEKEIDEKRKELFERYFDELSQEYKQQVLNNLKIEYQGYLNAYKVELSKLTGQYQEIKNSLKEIQDYTVFEVLSQEDKEIYKSLKEKLNQIKDEFDKIDTEEQKELVTSLNTLLKSLENKMSSYSKALYPELLYQDSFRDVLSQLVNYTDVNSDLKSLTNLKNLLEDLSGTNGLTSLYSELRRLPRHGSYIPNGTITSVSKEEVVKARKSKEVEQMKNSDYLLSFIRQSCDQFITQSQNSDEFQRTFWESVQKDLKSNVNSIQYVRYFANEVLHNRILYLQHQPETEKKGEVFYKNELNFCEALSKKIIYASTSDVNDNKIKGIMDALTNINKYLVKKSRSRVRKSATIKHKNDIYQNLLNELYEGNFKDSIFAIDPLKEKVEQLIRTMEINTGTNSQDFRRQVNNLLNELEKFSRVSSLNDNLELCKRINELKNRQQCETAPQKKGIVPFQPESARQQGESSQLTTSQQTELLDAIQKSCAQFIVIHSFQGNIPGGIKAIQDECHKDSVYTSKLMNIVKIQRIIADKIKKSNEHDPDYMKRVNSEKKSDPDRISVTQEFYVSLGKRIENMVHFRKLEQAFGDVLNPKGSALNDPEPYVAPARAN
ncbi:MAG: hypothetical protein AMJ43_02375 [Coxiella sp. DG_40]|nr:MAG: hypothetical protein AMJ43_02375 [Coxiella sp. DG_40]